MNKNNVLIRYLSIVLKMIPSLASIAFIMNVRGKVHLASVSKCDLLAVVTEPETEC